jgi:hypothetical protein
MGAPIVSLNGAGMPSFGERGDKILARTSIVAKPSLSAVNYKRISPDPRAIDCAPHLACVMNYLCNTMRTGAKGDSDEEL